MHPNSEVVDATCLVEWDTAMCHAVWKVKLHRCDARQQQVARR